MFAAMDESVVRSMARWPDVPDVYGWLALDRRGNWLVKDAAGGFGRISNAAVNDFIGRNYQHDGTGRWFFQNGPQRVFVLLHYTPLVYRLDHAGRSLCDHTGRIAHSLRAAWLDDAGGLVLQTELGCGAMDDRDLAGALALMRDVKGAAPDEAALAEEAETHESSLFMSLGNAATPITIGRIAARGLAARLGFVADPRPPAGQADC